jgi:hypothetical protein
MSSDQSTSDSQQFGGPVIGIMIAFCSVGVLLTLLSSNGIGGPNFAWFWGSANVGFAVSVLYLLTKIANGVYSGPDA